MHSSALFLVTQTVVADIQLDTGEIAVTIRGGKAVSTIGPGAGQSIPAGGRQYRSC